MNQWIVDVETYKNFFCCTFLNYKNDETHVFEISNRKNQAQEMATFLRAPMYLIGYNNLTFDNPIINYVANNKTTPDIIYEKAQLIITGQKEMAPQHIKSQANQFLKKNKYGKYETIDLMRLHASKKLRVSLKEMEVSMCWPHVQDLPFPHYKELTEEEMDEVIKYNLNDCRATKELCIRLKDDINLRIQIEKKYKIRCLSKDGVKTGVDLFAKLYEDKVGDDSFLEMRTHRPVIKLGECISDIVKFNSPVFNSLLETLKNTEITQTKGALNYSVIYGGVKHVYGTGGIHSKDKPGIYKPNPGEIYKDADVDSLYPSLLINGNYAPEHLDADIFVPLYKDLRDERLAMKKLSKTDANAKLISDTYKLSLNGTYGNLIQEHSWLYDPKAAMSITLNGQLMLSMLSERFTDAGFRVDSLNTDGITCFLPKDRESEYHDICKQWSEETNLSLEFANYYKVFRIAVNDYIAWYADNDGNPLMKDNKPVTKEKGFFLRELKLGRGYDKPIVPIALYKYFTEGISIEDTIRNHDNIYDFCMMQKMGSQFKAIHNNELLQKTNRFYASKNGAYLYKIPSDAKNIENASKKMHVLKDSGVTLFNLYEKRSHEEYKINYDFYIREARKIQREIESDQLQLF